jgi:hypothetical protein
MKLLNVRLGAEDSRIVAELRREGVQLSRIVREALRAAHTARRTTAGRRRRASDIMAAVYAQCPDPPCVPRRRVDLRYRASVRRAIVAAARRRRA